MQTATENLMKSMAGMSACCARLARELEDAAAETAILSSMPHWEGATLYFRAGKYAYLHDCKSSNCRIRKYVGCNPHRIRKAELLVARGILVTRARVRISRLEGECEQLAETLSRAIQLFGAVTEIESRLALEVAITEGARGLFSHVGRNVSIERE
jgi:hypothetical protein